MAKRHASLVGLQAASEKQNRLQDILQSWKDHPGRAPGGTGETGLLSTDKEGYSQMLNEQQEATNLQNELSGKGPAQVEQAPMRELHFDSAGLVPNGNPNYEEDKFWNPYSVDQFRHGGSLGALQRLVG
jgi:hypothetical protein